MSVESFLSHVHAASPTFHCYRCGDRTETASLVAPLSHTLGPPADVTAIQLLQEYLGPKANPFIELYDQHDGMVLYQDQRGDAQGLRLYPAQQWERQTGQMREGFTAMGYEPEEWPAGAIDTMAFAEIPHSGNYFTVKISGKNRGQIYYTDHDDFTDSPFAESFETLLSRITKDPAQFLMGVGCYTRYADGETSEQWIPKRFESGTR